MAYDRNEPMGKNDCEFVRSGGGGASHAAHDHLRVPHRSFASLKAEAGRAGLTERWEIYAGKMEIANGFSELNDPEDQRRRFESQLQDRERGDDEHTRWTRTTSARCRMECLRRADAAWAWPPVHAVDRLAHYSRCNPVSLAASGERLKHGGGRRKP